MLYRILTKKWMWFLYLIVFGALSLQRVIDFYSTDQMPHLYYQILMIFSINKGFVPLSYIFTILSLILNGAVFIILWFYIFEKQIFSMPFVALILLMKLIADFYGHSFEWNIVKSLYFESPSLALQVGLHLFLWPFPAYLALIHYIFLKKPFLFNIKKGR